MFSIFKNKNAVGPIAAPGDVDAILTVEPIVVEANPALPAPSFMSKAFSKFKRTGKLAAAEPLVEGPDPYLAFPADSELSSEVDMTLTAPVVVGDALVTAVEAPVEVPTPTDPAMLATRAELDALTIAPSPLDEVADPSANADAEVALEEVAGTLPTAVVERASWAKKLKNRFKRVPSTQPSPSNVDAANADVPVEPAVSLTTHAEALGSTFEDGTSGPDAPEVVALPVDTPLLTSPVARDSKLRGLVGRLKTLRRGSTPLSSNATPKLGLFGRLKLAAVPELEPSLPIRVIMGYFAEISEKDAREYAQGLAAKHFDQQSLVHFDAYKYDAGFVYEVHEGGSGRAYAPAVLKHFKSLGPLAPGEYRVIILKTASRYVEVQQLRDGLATILLPESAQRVPTEGIEATKAMTPALDRRNTFFKLSAGLFASGVVAMLLSGLIFRLQPIDLTAGPKPEVITASKLPRTQWSQLVNTPAGFYVKALRFQNGKWMGPELAPEAAPPPPAPVAAPLGVPPGSVPTPGVGVPKE